MYCWMFSHFVKKSFHLCHIVGMRSAVKHFADICVVGVGFGVVVAGEWEVRFEMLFIYSRRIELLHINQIGKIFRPSRMKKKYYQVATFNNFRHTMKIFAVHQTRR